MLGSKLEMGEGSGRMEKWTGVGNFSLWACQMMDKITAHGQDGAFATTLPTGVKQDDWDAQKKKICSYIRLNLSDEIKMEVLTMNSSTDIWAYLEKRYLNKSSSSRMLAKAKLWSCVMQEGTDLAAHVRHWTYLTGESIALGDKAMEDEDKAFLLLRSLPPSMDHLVQTMMYGKDTLTFDDVYNSLLSEAARKSTGGGKGSTSSSALNVEERGRSRNRGKGGARGKSGSKGRSKSQGKQGDKSHLECWFCHKKGHVQNDCWKKKKQDKKDGKKEDKSEDTKSSASANIVVAEEEDLLEDYVL